MPTGTVTFKDGATTLGTGALDGNGRATLTHLDPDRWSHSITAVYGGNANLNTSTSPPLGETVNTDNTTTTLISRSTLRARNQAVTFTANVVAGAPGTATPTGTVTFKDGDKTLGSSSAQFRESQLYDFQALQGARIRSRRCTEAVPVSGQALRPA